MKNLSKLIITAFLAIGLSACGLAQQNPATGYYNQQGQWVAGVNPNAMGGSACLTGVGQPLQFGFSAQGVDDVQARFFAGNIPQFGTGAGQHGQVTVGAAMAPMNQMGSIQMNKQSANGSLNLYYNQQQRTVSGQITLAGQALSTIMMSSMNNQQYGQYGQYPQMGSSVCVTSIALDVVYVSSSYGGGYNYGNATGNISMALLYVYLSNGQVVNTAIPL